MKKMFFLMLTLFMLSAANVNAQVQIGGTKGPDKSAVLDLNGDAGTANGGLALPRVELANDQSTLNGVEPQPGTVVYNTGSAQLAAGTYVWTQIDGGGGTAFTGISVNNTGANSTIGGTGTPASPLTVNVNANGITATQIANNAVTTDKLNALAVTGAKIADKTIPVSKIQTVAGDSGKVLRSDGKLVNWSWDGVVWSGITLDSTVNVLPVPTIAKFIRWLDTDINAVIAPNSQIAMKFTMAHKDDMCTTDNEWVTATTLTGQIRITNITNVNKTIHWVKCYHVTL